MEKEARTTPDANSEIAKLWRDFAATRDPQIKNELLVHYVDLVRGIVLRMMPLYRGYNEFDDLVSCGVIGLMDAIDKYDITQGVRFKTYAAVRIRGEIIDHMRKSDWAPSSLRRKISAVTHASDDLEVSLGRAPTEQEVANKLGMQPQDVLDTLEKSHMFNLVHFEDMLTETYTSIPDKNENIQGPEGAMEEKETLRLLAEVVESLPEKERTVISLYYYEGMTLRQIAEILGVSESRVSQIHSKVLVKMRGRLQAVFAG